MQVYAIIQEMANAHKDHLEKALDDYNFAEAEEIVERAYNNLPLLHFDLLLVAAHNALAAPTDETLLDYKKACELLTRLRAWISGNKQIVAAEKSMDRKLYYTNQYSVCRSKQLRSAQHIMPKMHVPPIQSQTPK